MSESSDRTQCGNEHPPIQKHRIQYSKLYLNDTLCSINDIHLKLHKSKGISLSEPSIYLSTNIRCFGTKGGCVLRTAMSGGSFQPR